jgi:hypothetical protein
MMSKHDHVKECTHELKVCAECDVAYCTKCEKEWGAPCTLNHYPYYWTYSQPTYPSWNPFGTSIGSVAGDTVSNADAPYTLTHAHN